MFKYDFYVPLHVEHAVNACQSKAKNRFTQTLTRLKRATLTNEAAGFT